MAESKKKVDEKKAKSFLDLLKKHYGDVLRKLADS